MIKFDFENFDYEKVKEEVKNSIKKPNILLCGATGVGKSSLINDIFNLCMDDDKPATVGKNGRPETRGVKKFTNDDSTINLYDSEGYEIGKIDQNQKDRYYTEIISYIDKLRNENSSQIEKHIHEVWYCISSANKRFYEIDKKIIETVKNKNVPVMILITKVDLVSKDELDQLIEEIRNQVQDVDIYTYSTELDESSEFVQKEKIVQWAINNLDESLRLGLLPAIKGCIKEKREVILKNCVPKYITLAVATVLGASFVPVPFSDSVPLMTIQIKMSIEIFNLFNINADVKEIVSNWIGTTFISYIGKTLASQIVSWIPAIGTATKVVVNTTVAASITAVLGAGITLIAEQYLIACINNGGIENLPFAEFLTKEKFSEIMSYVQKHKAEFGLDDIISQIINKYKNEG